MKYRIVAKMFQTEEWGKYQHWKSELRVAPCSPFSRLVTNDQPWPRLSGPSGGWSWTSPWTRVRILTSDWSTQITWPEHWPLIGQSSHSQPLTAVSGAYIIITASWHLYPVTILASDWSTQITWPEYWPLIGQHRSRDLNTDLLLVNSISILSLVTNKNTSPA